MTGPIPDTLRSHQLIRRDTLCAVMSRKNPLALKRKFSITDLHGQKLLLLEHLQNINLLFLKAADARNLTYQIHDTAGVSEFLPLIRSFDLTGFSTRELFLHYDYPEITFLPVRDDLHVTDQLETHLVSLAESSPSREARQFIDHVIGVHTEDPADR